MNNNEQLLILDYPNKKTRKKYLLVFAAYLCLLIFFNVLSSYKNPTIRVNNRLEDMHTYQFKQNIQTELSYIVSDLEEGSVSVLDDKLKEQLIHFYQNRNYKPAWIENFATNENFNLLINLLDSSGYFGFPFDYFNIEKMHVLSESSENEMKDMQQNQLELELTATYSALKFMLYTEHGILERDTSKRYLSSLPELAIFLNKALESDQFRSKILSKQPDLVHHRNLLKSLSHFIDLHYSVKYTTPAFINDKLLAKSLYYAEINKIPVFDSLHTKADALYALQDQFELQHDSILNNTTHEKLVSLLEYKYFLACLNINRLRNLKHSGENYLFVNIPEFKLHVIEANKPKQSFNIIVGKKKTPTPVFTSDIEKVIANPYWTVPRSITFEMLHKIRKDSTYLKRNGYFVINGREEIVNESVIDWNQDDPLGRKYWLRQINSSYNALGQVKFIFPNEHLVYLHDTPSKRLFKLQNRTFSHGCVRLENPDQLAQYLTERYSQEKSESFEDLISAKKRHEIALSEKVKIHIQYITCTVSKNSEVMFLNDIYNKDTEEIKAIFPGLLKI